ncbi:MAG: dihydroneopterin aldolase [Bacteroidaceae bacterium]|nr:dihydroneopterin aldolase [Bacteroidaceae bacterium]
MTSKMTFGMQNKIIINGLRIYAYHGVMEQERQVGAYFTIDCEVETDMQEAIEHDFVDGTISYADLYETIKREMAIPSFLVEHAAGRIAKAILNEYPKAHYVRIRLMKENPPMGADCLGAGVEVTVKG